jgi:cell division protein FtsB
MSPLSTLSPTLGKDDKQKSKSHKRETPKSGKENVQKNTSSSSVFGSIFGKSVKGESKREQIAKLSKENAALKQRNNELEHKMHSLKSQVAEVINSS